MSGFAFHYLHGVVASLCAGAVGWFDVLQRRVGVELIGMFSPGDGDVLIIGAEPECGSLGAAELLVPIVFFASIVAIVMSVVAARHHTARRRLDLARVMVERGLEPPADLLGQRGDQHLGHQVDLRRGVVLGFLGVGIVLAGALSGEPEGLLGLIPGFIGLGYLVSYRLLSGGRTR